MISILPLSAKITSLNSLASGPEPSTGRPDPDAFCGFNKAHPSEERLRSKHWDGVFVEPVMKGDMEFNLSVDADLNGLEDAFDDVAEEMIQEYLEEEASEDHFECECGGTVFDVEAWESNSGDVEAAAVCQNCNTQHQINVEISGLK
ncbi:hypothetical protein [Halorubrum ezzemoulense]|uniref:hypothetical protein n=1 Tax=Halorubrum ezzemoulense TaxID=337243 RepID=UPI0011401B56|nr:hypothetical protein [Halorubrum ezzemoulense]